MAMVPANSTETPGERCTGVTLGSWTELLHITPCSDNFLDFYDDCSLFTHLLFDICLGVQCLIFQPGTEIRGTL